MIEIELANNPVAWAASRVGKRGHFNPRAAEKNFTRWQIKAQYRRKPLEGFVVLEFEFFFRIPNSTSKKRREEMLTCGSECIPTCSDLTNLQKFYEDCLKEIVIGDDRNVALISSKKLYAEKGKILIRVFPLKEHQEMYGNQLRRY